MIFRVCGFMISQLPSPDRLPHPKIPSTRSSLAIKTSTIHQERTFSHHFLPYITLCHPTTHPHPPNLPIPSLAPSSWCSPGWRPSPSCGPRGRGGPRRSWPQRCRAAAAASHAPGRGENKVVSWGWIVGRSSKMGVWVGKSSINGVWVAKSSRWLSA